MAKKESIEFVRPEDLKNIDEQLQSALDRLDGSMTKVDEALAQFDEDAQAEDTADEPPPPDTPA